MIKKKHILSFILGLTITGLFHGIVYFFLFLSVFEIFGTTWITDPESEDAKVFYTSLCLTVFTGSVVFFLIRDKNKPAAIGTSIPLSFALFLLIYISITYLNKSNYYEPFDSIQWKNQEKKPLKMARALIKSEELIGLTKTQLIKKLGNGSKYNWKENDILTYETDPWVCRLAITFENNKVKSAQLWVDD